MREILVGQYSGPTPLPNAGTPMRRTIEDRALREFLADICADYRYAPGTEGERKDHEFLAAILPGWKPPLSTETSSRVREMEWNPADHPRGGFDDNRGKFSDDWGPGGGPAGTRPRMWPDEFAQAPQPPGREIPWYSSDKNPRTKTLRGNNDTKIDIHFSNITDPHVEEIANRAEDTLKHAETISGMFERGELTKDSKIVRDTFGQLDDRQFKKVVATFKDIADQRNRDGTLFKAKSDPNEGADANARTSIVGIRSPGGNVNRVPLFRSKQLTLMNNYFKDRSPTEQEAILFHELTHIPSEVDDYAYYDGRTGGYVDWKTGKPYRMTADKLVDNASSYEKFYRDTKGVLAKDPTK